MDYLKPPIFLHKPILLFFSDSSQISTTQQIAGDGSTGNRVQQPERVQDADGDLPHQAHIQRRSEGGRQVAEQPLAADRQILAHAVRHAEFQTASRVSIMFKVFNKKICKKWRLSKIQTVPQIDVLMPHFPFKFIFRFQHCIALFCIFHIS